MPIYEYKCSKCGETFEAFQKINDTPLTACKFCHGKVERLISHSSFQLKGSGWYLTDYARKSAPPSGSTDSASKTDVKTDAKTDSKTAKGKDTGSSSKN